MFKSQLSQYQFGHKIWVALLCMLVTRACYFMIWPFISLMLYKQQVTITSIAFLLGGSTFIVIVTGFFSGYLSDLKGRTWLVRVGLIIMSGCMLWLSIANSFLDYAMSIIIFSFGKGLFDVPFRALLSDLIEGGQRREQILNLNYFLVNIGTSVGALIGVKLGFEGILSIFTLTAMLYFILVVLLLIFKLDISSKERIITNKHNFINAIKIVGKNKLFLKIMGGNIIFMFVIDQVNTSVMMYVSRLNIENIEQLLSQIVTINSVGVILLHGPILWLCRNVGSSGRMVLGMTILLTSQIGFYFSNQSWLNSWLLATLVLTVAEIIVFPTANIIIDKMAPEGQKGNFFAVSSMSAIGWILAPIIGGTVIELWGFGLLCLICALICCPVIYFYRSLPQQELQQEN